ncbi:MAG TPA: aspartate--tRNA ligase [Bacteroidetes bacterium]|nr:aspartate--tRNA ligase [Bacteroidota bacterium]
MTESQKYLSRTHTCGELNENHTGKKVTLSGWVDRRRDHGGLIFIDLRDRYGKTQLVFNPQRNREMYESAKELKPEYVIAIEGIVQKRPEDALNPNLATGKIEVSAENLQIFNEAKTPPFQITDNNDASEELRLKYRYLDLRRSEMQRNIILRHRLSQVVRNYFNSQNFIEIETPVLMKSTPEGARDFLVPSRLHKGRFYALPQSPQTYKQLLMVAGFDRYFQITRCFRDEDLRADRQPEFTQIDVEMSFVDENAVLAVMENLMSAVYKELFNINLQTPLPRIGYRETITRYGIDRPDLRFGLEIQTVTGLVSGTEFRVFNDAIAGDGVIAGLSVPGGAEFSRKQVDELNRIVQEAGGKGLLPLKVKEGKLQGGAAKFLSETQMQKLTGQFSANEDDLILLAAGETDLTYKVLGVLRTHLGNQLNLIDRSRNELLWVVDFPLLEYDEEEGRYVAMHHPFTSPKPEDIPLMGTDPGAVRARAYDLVLNGTEIAGGSIRIHRRDLQQKMFKLLGIGEEEAKEKFGFLMEAFEYGAPPHGGIAFGFDRLAMILAGRKSIRDVIAFPKTTSAISLMDGAPSSVDEKQLAELGLKIDVPEIEKENE